MFGSLKIVAIMAVIMAVMLGGFYWYYTDSQKKIATLTANNAKLEIALNLSEQALASIQKDQATANDELRRVNQALSAARQQNKQLADRITSKNYGQEAIAAPIEAEKYINLENSLGDRCAELLTGAPLTDAERNAKNAQEFNSECPWLYNGSTAP